MRGRTILIAVAEEFPLRVLGYNLRKFGASVFLARGGPEAISIARRTWPDVVIADMELPGLDGPRVCRQLRQMRPDHDVACILLAEAGVTIPRVDLIQAKIAVVLRKPLGIRQIRSRIDALLMTKSALVEPIAANLGD